MLVSQYSNYPISSLNNLEVNPLAPAYVPMVVEQSGMGNEPLIFTQVKRRIIFLELQ